MAEEKMKKHKGTHKAAFPVGSLIIILAAIGLVTIVVSAVKGIDTAIQNSKHYEEYDTILTPVVLIDPDTFDDITKADMNQLMEITIWSLLKGDIEPDTFESNESGLSIPKAAVEEEFIELFGTEVSPVHQTIEGYGGLEFVYDTKTETYTVPLTGITPIYTPQVVDKTTSSDTVVLTVACLAGDAWEQGENGDMVAPTPDKYLKITLREQNENLYISAIQNTTTPEVATTEATESTTENVNDDIVASDTTTEEPSSTEEESSSADAEAEQQQYIKSVVNMGYLKRKTYPYSQLTVVLIYLMCQLADK